MNLSHPAAVVFDMDGVLFDSGPPWQDSFFAAATDLGHHFTTGEFLKLIGRPWSANRIALQERIGSEREVDDFYSVWMRYYDTSKDIIALKIGAVELLDRLEELQVPRALCTSSSREDVDHYLTRHALSDRFDAIIAAGDYVRENRLLIHFFAPRNCWASCLRCAWRWRIAITEFVRLQQLA